MIYHGDSLVQLRKLESESIDLIITSPPYYGLRNYGVDGQIGLEKTPQDYINNLMNVFTECKRVLKKTGSLWVNIGDTYGTVSGGSVDYLKGNKKIYGKIPYHEGIVTSQDVKKTLVQKSLIGIPERFVIAMTDAGWIRRNTIIWYKPNCMPSSAKDRFTVDFEYFYFFTKSQRYYFETQYEPLSNETILRYKRGVSATNKWVNGPDGQTKHTMNQPSQHDKNREHPHKDIGRLKRTVWQIPTQPLKEAHFAVFPEKLIETPINACCPPNGIVLDPFCGSGTTCLVAKKLGRQYIGIDLNPQYIQIAQKRIDFLMDNYLK